jgi:hypothetical protein
MLKIFVTPEMLGNTADEFDVSSYIEELYNALEAENIASVCITASSGPRCKDDHINEVMTKVHEAGAWVARAEKLRKMVYGTKVLIKASVNEIASTSVFVTRGTGRGQWVHVDDLEIEGS